MKREGNVLSDILRQAWDGERIQTLTKSSPFTATNTHVSVLGHITQAELAKCFADVDAFNGFYNRFLWVLVKRSKLLPDGGEIQNLDALRSRLSSVTQTASTIVKMERSPAASALWRDIYGSLSEVKLSPIWDAVTSRSAAHVLRLSMLYALLDGVETIEVPHLQAALAVWRYCDDSARILFADGPKPDTLSDKVRRLLECSPPLTKTEIRDGISGRIDADELADVLENLEAVGEIVSEEVVHNRNRHSRYSVRSVGESVSATASPPTDRTDEPIAATVSSPQPTDRTNEPKPATMAELFDWRNANGADFIRNEKELIWVTTEQGLTPSLKAAIEANQETLSAFVPKLIDEPDGSKTLTESEFWHGLKPYDPSVKDAELDQEIEDVHRAIRAEQTA